MKYFIIFIIYLTSTIGLNAQIELLGGEVYINFHINNFKKEDLKKYKFYIYYDSTIRGFFKYNNFFYSNEVSAKCEKGKPFNLIVYNPQDSSIKVVSDFCFDVTNDMFIFKENLYLFVTDNTEKKNSYTTLLCIKKENPNICKNSYTFKEQNQTCWCKYSPGDPYVTIKSRKDITVDKNGNLKLLISSFKSKINVTNLLLSWMPRGVGSIWELDEDSEKNTWYVFDDDLNLLYTEEYKEE